MILMMGIAGSGKGTQGALLAKEENLTLISMGDAIRAHVTGERRQEMLAGQFLNDQETIEIIDEVLNGLPDQDKVILDGFPRTAPQAKWLLEQSKTDRFTISHIIHLVAAQEAVKERLLHRARVDDKEDSIEQRFKLYHEATEPLLDWFADNNLAVTDVNAERSVDDVNDDLVALLHK